MVPKTSYSTLDEIKGIYSCLNVVEISLEGCETVLGIVERFVEQLVKLDR